MPMPFAQIAFERTYPQMKEMVELAGLRIKKVHNTRQVAGCYHIFDARTKDLGRGWASITEVVRA